MIYVMMSGLPGKMASLVAGRLVQDERFQLLPFALTGPEITYKSQVIYKSQVDEVIDKEKIGRIIDFIRSMERTEMVKGLKDKYGSFLVVDFTHPDAVNSNAEFYIQQRLPFVMGTTGGDRAALVKAVEGSEIAAVIAPNMGKQIIAFQAMMEYVAQNFPDAFAGYTLEIIESHQRTKADTSGTAKAMVKYFNALGIPFAESQIVMIRKPEEQLKMGVPEEALTGHAWHTYKLRSADGTVFFQFTHNVNGRETYVAGTVDALVFLNQKVQAGAHGKVYSMMDVLRGI